MLKKMLFLCVALVAPLGLSMPVHAQSFSYHGPHMGSAWGGYYGYPRYPAYRGYGHYRRYSPYWRGGAWGYGYAYQPSYPGYYGTYDYYDDRFGLGSQSTRPPGW
jgi:hypothetical protein